MSGIPDLGKMVTLLSKYSNSSIKAMTVTLLPTMFIGHHFAQPRGQAHLAVVRAAAGGANNGLITTFQVVSILIGQYKQDLCSNYSTA
jgi:hypothetical protein